MTRPTLSRLRSHAISRRSFLRGASGATLALPFLGSLNRVQANIRPPQRLLIFFTPNGTKKELWTPPGTAGVGGPLGELGPLLRPLERHRRRLVLLDGVNNDAAQRGPGGPHQRGMASLLSGVEIGEGDFVGGDGRRAGWGGGISIDQFAAQSLGTESPFRSIELGVRVLENIPRARLSYVGPGQPLPPVNDPIKVFERLFQRPGDLPQTLHSKLDRRRSVLDAVYGDFQALEAKLGLEDRERFGRHVQTLRDLERRLSLMIEQPLLCDPGSPGEELEVNSEQNFGEIAHRQRDLITQAFACDLTRVATLQCSSAVNALRLSFASPSLTSEGHALSHAGDGNATMQGSWEQMLSWYAELFASILDSLEAVPEGEGTLLDHTLVLWCNELGRGNNHSLDDLPFILAGGTEGAGAQALRFGQHIVADGIPHNRLLLTMLQALGLPLERFGAPDLCEGGVIPGLIT